MAAPKATTSSGLTPLDGSLPKKSLTKETTFGIRVIPPTKTTSLTFLIPIPASFKHFLHGSKHLLIKSAVKDSNLALVKVINKFFAPDEPGAMNGKLISGVVVDDNSILAFSAASLTR